jgi:hypothetical protein
MYFVLAALLVVFAAPGSARAIALDLSGDLAVQVAESGSFNDPEIGLVTFAADNGTLQAGSPIGVDCTSGVRCWLDDPSQLNWLESMTIDFGDAGTVLHTVTLTDLDILGSTDSVRFVDGGYIDTGKSLIAFSAADAVNGTVTVNVEQSVESIRLTTSNVRGASYRLAGLSYGTVTPTPEVDSSMAFAAGGLLVAVVNWRRFLRA